MRVLLAAGGSGGHVIPAIALAQRLKQRQADCTCLAVSGGRGVSESLWDRSIVEWTTVPVEPWPTGWGGVDPRYWWRQTRAAVWMTRVLRRFGPHVVVGFGGYVSGPAVMLAKWLRIPTVIHEQNVFPGRATQWLSRWADRVAISFDETRAFLPHAQVTVTGNPVRSDLGSMSREAALESFGLTKDKPVLLIVGGSQGSHWLNTASLTAMACLTPAERRTFQVIHLTGSHDESWVTERYRALNVRSTVRALLPSMAAAYAAATLAVARAGATTLAELVACAVPAVLVPYPYAGGHQAMNAQWISRRGGAIAIDQGAFTPERWEDVVWPLLSDRPRLEAMRGSLRQFVKPGAADRLAQTVLEAAHAV